MALKHLSELSREEELFQKALTEKINQVAYSLDRSGLIEEGREEGSLSAQKKIALNMLRKNSEISFISEVTGLSEEEITQLKK